jgi:hypothetical protein
VSVGLRMLGGMEVAPGEFVLLAALDVAQTFFADYRSTAEFNTEFTYAIIRNGLNVALMLVGMWLMGTGPWGILAGLALMLAGDKLLDVLGLKGWLARKFDPRPNEMIDLDDSVQSLMKTYAFQIGAAELGARQDLELKGLGADDPAALRAAMKSRLDANRILLTQEEQALIVAFKDAYRRARGGHVGLKWLDDQRERFLDLFFRAHHDDPPREPSTEPPHTYVIEPLTN